VLARVLSAVALACLLASGSAAQQADPDRALREWGRSVGMLGYVYGAPLLELAIADYRQTQGLARDMASLRGLLAHGYEGRLPTHEATWLATPEPDVLRSSAWLDLRQQPYLLWIPPMDGHWYSIQFADAFAGVAAALSARTIGSVGGWYLVAHSDWQGERPPGVMDEVRIPTPLVWLSLRIAATPANAADFHARYQSQFKLLPLEVYARNPKAAALASPQPQASVAAPIRAAGEMRGTLDAFRIINHRLRQLAPAPGEAALLALFDRAGFGPGADFEPGRLPPPLLEGLRAAARDAHRTIRDLRFQAHAPRNGWSSAPAALGAFGDDYLARAVAASSELGANLPVEVATATASVDSDGRALDGRNDYVIRFEGDALPPAEAFWSIAAYDAETRLLMDTRTGRHSIGSQVEGLHLQPSGALRIFLSSDAPEDPARRANWLPVATRPFFLVARLYQPLPAALDGSYALPPVVPADD
jgi:hypothetical protein